MTILLNKSNLYNTFDVSSFEELETSFVNISPSMTEYYLSDLASVSSEELYLNKSNIQKSLTIDSYSLYLDYSDDIYLEITQNQDSDAQALW